MPRFSANVAFTWPRTETTQTDHDPHRSFDVLDADWRDCLPYVVVRSD